MVHFHRWVQLSSGHKASRLLEPRGYYSHSLLFTTKTPESSGSSFKYLELNIKQNQDSIEITIDQHDYIEQLQSAGIERKTPSERQLDKEEESRLFSISSQITWATNQTRPDLAFGSCQERSFGKSPDIKMLKEATNTLRKLQSRKVSFKITNAGDLKKVKILCYIYATRVSLKFKGAYLICLYRNGNVVPVAEQSNKISRVLKIPLFLHKHWN